MAELRYFQDKRSGKKFRWSRDEEPNNAEQITQEQFEEDSFSLRAVAPRPIYAKVAPEVFSKFAKRCKQEGITIEEALCTLCTLYAEGAKLLVNSTQKKHAWSYLDTQKE